MNFAKKGNRRWYAVYTRSRAEKKVELELQLQGIECYLPLQKKLRQWKDRKKWVEVPLMPGYCFVHIHRGEYDRVLQTNHVVCYITFEGKAAVVRTEQIEALQTMLRQSDFEVEVSYENFEKGKRVEIIEGPLIGLRGELSEVRGKHKFLLRIEQLDKNFIVEVPAAQLSAIPENDHILS